MPLAVEISIALASVAIAVAALLSSRRQARMTSLMLYNSGWTEFNKQLATNEELQAAFASLEGHAELFNPKTRAFLYYVTLAENAYNLHREGLLPRKEYKRFMRLTGKFVRGSEGFDFQFLQSIGFSDDYVRVLEKTSR
ncbi:MAG: hypothetical protein AAF668_06995 [Pseudomonadota bacterium]